MEKLIDTLIAKLRKGIVSFVYNKKDGSERHAVGTLFGVGHTIKNSGQKDCSWVLKYYDIDCKGWRSFIIENLVSVGDFRKGTMEEHHDICLALVVKLKETMKKCGNTAFAYRKVDGTIRYAHGVLLPEKDIDGKYFVYFDTDKNEQRKFRIDSFIGFGEADEIDFSIFENNPTPCVEIRDIPKNDSSAYKTFSDGRIADILKQKGIEIEDTENIMVIDLLPYLNKEQLKDLIIKATTRLAEI